LTPGRDDAAELVAGVPNANLNNVLVYTLEDLRNPALRLNISPSTIPPGGGTPSLPPPVFATSHPLGLEGTDLLLTDVLSFEVQVDWTPSGVTGCMNPPRTSALGNWDAPFDALAFGQPAANTGRNSSFPTGSTGLFDTWYPSATWNSFVTPDAQTLPLAVRVKQLRIILRIFDKKTMQTRQSTFVVEM
jgi:hypothetical protein